MPSMTQQELFDGVIEQLHSDIEWGNFEAIEELLKFVPRANLIAYLSEENIDIDLDGGLSATNE